MRKGRQAVVIVREFRRVHKTELVDPPRKRLLPVPERGGKTFSVQSGGLEFLKRTLHVFGKRIRIPVCPVLEAMNANLVSGHLPEEAQKILLRADMDKPGQGNLIAPPKIVKFFNLGSVRVVCVDAQGENRLLSGRIVPLVHIWHAAEVVKNLQSRGYDPL